MLIQFSLENFKSFREQQMLSFVSTPGDEHIDHTLLLKNGLRINRFCALIGGNGAGKTQLIFAINELALAIHKDEYSQLHKPFSLSKDSRDKATVYEIIILDSEKENFLRYGISTFHEKILNEYLYSRPVKKGAREQCIFTRDSDGVKFKKASYKKHELLINPILKDTGSVITFSKSLEAEELSELKYWAIRQLPYRSNMFGDKTIEFFEERFQKKMIKNDNGDDEFDSETKKHLDLYNDFITRTPLHIDGVKFVPFGKENKYHFLFEIKGPEGELITIEPDMRYDFFSEGTMNILTFIAAMVWSYQTGFTLYVDEIDSSVHHSLASSLIKSVLNNQTERDDMQFVISTHNIPLLDECFRRDEVNIIIKSDNKSSQIINASTFSVRKDAKISAKYFRGEFGVLPNFLGL
ncbi:TPA: ATP-binding protein [Serratia marcescens]|uniref:AAA family ATPase n=1 Tax=Serratia nevei TaxID=2703794 RepID=UPI0018DA356C|nr:ATP-binding protein [Serratia marcescens]HEJ7125217.1 ATP-binding protein [Serratia marcescens]HEJ7142832.1 ATP-binding protein [Serratia marcescens]HEJ7223864.1 ATP-binding protein [Serratia marcescens]